MNNRLLLALALFFFVIAAHAAPVPPATNKDGSVVSGFTRANFDPAAGVTPLPFNLLFLGTTDLALNPPLADLYVFSHPLLKVGLDKNLTEQEITYDIEVRMKEDIRDFIIVNELATIGGLKRVQWI